ncbi:MAG: response regulator [SAR324 cluster bacterium]|nr:response regulator [SAR324 cluster bacterium]
MENKTEVHGSFIYGITETFQNLSIITQSDCDKLIKGINPNNWYPLLQLRNIFKVIEKGKNIHPQLLFQAGAAMMQSWYDNVGKELNLGSMGQIRLQDDSQGIKEVVRNFDEEKVYSKLLTFDEEKGCAILDVSFYTFFPTEFWRGVYHHELLMWGDLDWLEIGIKTLAADEDYTRNHITYNFRLRKSESLDKEIDEIISNLSPGENSELSSEISNEIVWKYKGLQSQFNIEKTINTLTNKLFGDSFNKQHQTAIELRKATQTAEKAYLELEKKTVDLSNEVQERKKTEKELHEAKEKAEEATKVKSEFLANMSHEIRTPMNAIMGMTHLALETDLTPKQQDYLKKTHSSATSLLGLINDILDFSKIEAGKMDMESVGFHLDDVLDNVSTLISIKAEEKGLRLVFETLTSTPKFLVGDSLRLGQILINLSNNAVKFTEKGSITIETELVEETGENYTIQFTVRDTGIGLTKEQIGKLFTSFSQADSSTTRKFGGTGLGLTISKQLVEMMDGKIWVESEPGEGSSFIFTAVFGHGNEAEITARSPQEGFDTESLRSIQGARILLVEDNEINQQVAQEILEKAGFVIDVAGDGKQAVEAVDKTFYDLVLMDIQMPVMDGYESTKVIRKESRFKDLPILAMSASAMTQDLEKVTTVGMNGHVAKPIELKQLYSALLEWIEPGERELPEAVIVNGAQESSIENNMEFPTNLPGIDTKTGLERVARNDKLYRKLLKKFSQNQANSTEEIKKALKNKDIELAIRLAHTIKGVAGNIGAMDLHVAARDLESGIQQDGADVAKILLESVQVHMDQVLASIAEMKNESGESAAKSDDSSPLIDRSKIKSIINELAQLLEDDDTGATSVFESFKRYLKGAEVETELSELERLIGEYDYEEALEWLNCIVAKLDHTIDAKKSNK